MNIDDELIGKALLRSSASDLEDVLTTIEAYRTCVVTARRLGRTCGMEERRSQVLECAGHCRKTLEDYAASGKIGERRSPASGEARFVFAVKW